MKIPKSWKSAYILNGYTMPADDLTMHEARALIQYKNDVLPV